MNQPHSIPPRILKAAEALLLLVAAIFLALHAVHLNADFPNHSPWMDWAKYTDEGWYGDGAIRHFQRGHWHVPGDFNPAAALPVWPLLEAVLFRFTGVSLAAARALTVAIFACILFTSYLLLRRWQLLSSAEKSETSLAPAIAVLLLAVSPFCYVFSRMAILEPLLILFTLLALLAASYIRPLGQGSPTPRRYPLLPTPYSLLPVLLGLLLPLMVLTKTTAIFLFPAIAWLLWARAGYRVRPFLRLSFPSAALASVIWLSYYLFVAIPLTLLVPIVFSTLWNSGPRTRTASEARLHRLAIASIAAVLTVVTVTDARQTLHYVRTPDYSFTSAAGQIHRIISADPTHNPLILSISGSQLSLMTGLPSICDDFGTMDLPVRVQAYHPGWYVTWNQVDDDKMDALTPMYHLQRIAAFPAFDDPERNLLILYRLDPPTPSEPPRRHRKPVIPRLLQTTFGKPSPTQLVH